MSPKATRLRVYVVCRPIFSGNEAHVRKLKVKELVNNNKESLGPLLQDIGETKLIETLRGLLEDRIFESEPRAKVEFPELFRPSPIRDAQRQASEIDAARSAAEALDEIASQDGHLPGSEDEESGGSEDDIAPEEIAVKHDTTELPAGPPTDKCGVQATLPSLYPSYMLYAAQHLILTTAQRVLEECYFDFARSTIPSVLKERRWDCPAAVELTRWIRMFRVRDGRLCHPMFPAELGTPEAQGLLMAVSKLRHTAVHRLPTTARGISQLLESALKLARVLGDDWRATQLEELWSDVNSKIKAMELNKNVLEDMASNELRRIHQKRAELDMMEAEVIQKMLTDDMDNKALIGRLLEESVHDIFSKKEDMKENNGKKEDWEDEGTEEEAYHTPGGEEQNIEQSNNQDVASAVTG